MIAAHHDSRNYQCDERLLLVVLIASKNVCLVASIGGIMVLLYSEIVATTDASGGLGDPQLIQR